MGVELVVENIKTAFIRYKENWKSLVAGVLVSYLIFLLISGLGVGIFVLLNWNFVSTLILDPSALSDFDFATLIPGLLITGVFVLVAIVLEVALYAGQVGMSYEALTGKTRLKTLFEVAKLRGKTAIVASFLFCVLLLVPFLISIILFILSPMIGIVFLIPVAIILSFLMTLYYQAIVVSGVSAVDALKTSIAVVKVYWSDLLILILVYVLISYVLSLIPIAGALISFLVLNPVVGLSFVKFYVDRTTTVPSIPSSPQTPETPSQT